MSLAGRLASRLSCRRVALIRTTPVLRTTPRSLLPLPIHRSHYASVASVMTAGSPHGTPQTPQAFGNFDLVKEFKLDYADITISKWQSRVTGLSVVHLDYEGVSGIKPHST
jgi:hypothetical protein